MATAPHDMQSQLAALAQQQRQANMGAAIEQSAAMNPDNNIPFDKPNQFEAAIRKSAEDSVEYQRLRTEEAREQWRNMAAAQIQKEKDLAEHRTQEADLKTAQNQDRNARQMQAIAQQLNGIQILPGENAYTMPQEKLVQLSNLTQEWNALRERAPELEMPFFDERIWDPMITTQQAIAPVNQKHPATFENGRYSDVKQNEDGSVEVKLPNNRLYRASNMAELVEELSKANVHSTRYAQEQKALAQQSQQQPTSQQPDAGQQYSSISDYWTDQQAEQVSNALAKRYGFSNEQEMVQYFKRNEEIGQSLEDKALAADFHSKHPEFPGTDAASDTLTGIIEANGWEWNLTSMEAAHALAVQRGLYSPLSPELVAASNGTPVQNNRPAPPPMPIRGANPEMHNQEPDAWSMDLQALRQRAIRQQLEGGR